MSSDKEEYVVTVRDLAAFEIYLEKGRSKVQTIRREEDFCKGFRLISLRYNYDGIITHF